MNARYIVYHDMQQGFSNTEYIDIKFYITSIYTQCTQVMKYMAGEFIYMNLINICIYIYIYINF